jgi:hypothetical protein
MKTVELRLELTFEDSISDDKEIHEIMKNVVRAIRNEADGMGIAPEDSDTFTTKIVVRSIYTDDVVEDNLLSF